MTIQYSICSNKPDTTGGRVPEEQHFQDFQPDSSARHSCGGEHSFPVSSGVPAPGRHHPHLQCKDGKVTVAYFKFLHFICTINFFFGGGIARYYTFFNNNHLLYPPIGAPIFLKICTDSIS